MSIRDVMMIEDAINLATLPAGAGDFSRTAFEHSNVLSGSGTLKYCHSISNTIAKFVAPATGIYRYSYEYKSGVENCQEGEKNKFQNSVVMTLYAMPRIASYYGDSQGRAVKIIDSEHKIEGYLSASINSQAMPPNGIKTISVCSTQISYPTYTALENYFNLQAGDVIALGFSGYHTVATPTESANTIRQIFYSFRNQKITY